MSLDLEMVSFFIEDAEETLEVWESSCLLLEDDPSEENLNALFRAAHNLKGGSRSVGLEAYGELVHKIEDKIELFRSGEASVSAEAVAVVLEGQKILSEWTESLKGDPTTVVDYGPYIQKLDAAFSGSANSRVNAPQEETGPSETNQAGQAANPEKASMPSPAKKGHQESIRVSTEKIDSLLRTIGELAIQNEILWHGLEGTDLRSKLCLDAHTIIYKGLKELQQVSLSLRMLPIEILMKRLERIIRDIARDQKKEVKVEIRGIDVELDKIVIEKIKDALVHIVRNAIDHGVEDGDKRRAAGKEEKATISMTAVNKADGVELTIADDGAGLNADKIKAKAVERGLVQVDQSLSDEDIYQLIFQPGFSTAEKVTDVSGRGVGMDVVRSTITDLGGSVRIESGLGKGTSFVINLPSSLSILNALVVEVDKTQYAMPIQDLDEIITLGNFDLQSTQEGRQALYLRDEYIQVELIGEYLPVDLHQAKSNFDQCADAIVCRVGRNRVAFAVDRIVGQQSVVIRPLEGGLSSLPGLAGATILGNGEPGMIIDLPSITQGFIERIQKGDAKGGEQRIISA